MNDSPARWILAFDGSCGSCGGVADAVSAACGDRIEVFPLQNPTVSGWRRAALGEDAEWKPVLMKVSAGDEVQAWSGGRLASHLVARLGVGPSVGILRALGQLRSMNSRGEVRRPGDTEPLAGLSRKRFLRNVGLGAATVTGILISGTAPASADTVASWKRVKAGELPTTLAEIAVLPIAFRRVAYQEMTSEQQSASWTAHLDGFTSKIAELGGTQQLAFAKARAFAKDPVNFETTDLSVVDALSAEMVKAFGKEEAASLIAVLGPREKTSDGTVVARARGCTCAVASDYCTNSTNCYQNLQGCIHSSKGCGSFYLYSCDGLCSS